MAYHPTVRQARQCRASKANGERCRAFARWGADDGLCAPHHFSHATMGTHGQVRGLLVTYGQVTPLTEHAARCLAERRAPWVGGNLRRPLCDCAGFRRRHRPGIAGCFLSDRPNVVERRNRDDAS